MGLPRSGSSLLMHILESNNELIGYSEYFIKYTCSKKIIKLNKKKNILIAGYPKKWHKLVE